MLKRFIQNFIKQNPKPLLGRWSLKKNNDKENITVFNTNRDHCGDQICGDPMEHIKMSPKTKITKMKVKDLKNST